MVLGWKSDSQDKTETILMFSQKHLKKKSSATTGGPPVTAALRYIPMNDSFVLYISFCCFVREKKGHLSGIIGVLFRLLDSL